MSKTWTTKLPYFSEKELACKGTGVLKLDIRFAIALVVLRWKLGKVMKLTSVCRSPAHNKSVGGHPRSLHLTTNPKHPSNGCMAADVYWKNWPTKEKLAFTKLAWSLGWAVGLHKSFCHIDRRGDLGLNKQVFLYGTWTGEFTPQAVKTQLHKHEGDCV